MKAKYIIAGVLLSTYLTPTSLFSQSSLKGVWKGLEYHFQGADTAYIWKDIQPCLFLFSERHYSMVYVAGTKPRPLLPEGITRSNASIEQLREMIIPFVANSGTYEVNDTAFIVLPMVALNPNVAGSKRPWSYKLEKDVLWLSGKDNSGNWRLKLSRLE